MQDTVLVPLDGSRLAETVLLPAARGAYALAAKVTLLRAVPAPVQSIAFDRARGGLPTLRMVWQAQLAEAEGYLKTQAQYLERSGLAADTVVVDCDPVSAIHNYTAQHPEVALMAMATHGYSGLRQIALGSVASSVLRRARVPLLLIRPTAASPNALDPASLPYHTILVPIDGFPYGELAVDQACLLAARSGATLHLLAVIATRDRWTATEPDIDPAARLVGAAAEFEQVETYMHSLARRARARGLKVYTQISHDLPGDEISRAAEQAAADVIVMVAHARSGWQKLLRGSPALDVVRGAGRPVLITRAEMALHGVEQTAATRHAAPHGYSG